MLTEKDDEHKATAKKILLVAIATSKVRANTDRIAEAGALADSLSFALDELATHEWIIWAAQVVHFCYADEEILRMPGAKIDE